MDDRSLEDMEQPVPEFDIFAKGISSILFGRETVPFASWEHTWLHHQAVSRSTLKFVRSVSNLLLSKPPQ
jgi:hypothetical protein